MKNDLDFLRDKLAQEGAEAPSEMDEKYVMETLSGVEPKVIGVDKNKKRRMGALIGGIAAALALVIGVTAAIGTHFVKAPSGTPYLPSRTLDLPGGLSLIRFSSHEEINNAVKELKAKRDSIPMKFREDSFAQSSDMLQGGYSEENSFSISNGSSGSSSGISDGARTSDPSSFSETYKQVDGVDEADIIKTDGRYIYCTDRALSDDIIVFSADNGRAERVAEISVDSMLSTPDEADIYCASKGAYVEDFYLHGDRLIVVCDDLSDRGGYTDGITRALVYDIGDVDDISLIDSFTQSGYRVSSRMIGDMLYIVSDYTTYEDNYIPACGRGSDCREMPADQVYSVEDPDQESFLVISAYNTADHTAQTETKAILGAAQDLYCSGNNMYIYATDWGYEPYSVWSSSIGVEVTKDNSDSSDITSRILKVSLSDGIDFTAYTQIEGSIYGQYAFDESGGYLRVATTSENEYDRVNTNNLFVLDEALNTVGSVNGFARNEEIKAVRYFGDTAYVITYEQTDPLFVIDLSEPSKPQITGSVEISGFSSMLVPVGGDLVLGIGYHDENNVYTGYITQSGTKLALFDVSDKSEPKVLDTKSYIDHYSVVQHNPKALVYNPDRDDYLIPLNYEYYGYYDKTTLEYTEVNEYKGGYLNFKISDGRIIETDKHTADCNSVDRCVYIGDYVYMTAFDNGRLNVLGAEYK